MRFIVELLKGLLALVGRRTSHDPEPPDHVTQGMNDVAEMRRHAINLGTIGTAEATTLQQQVIKICDHLQTALAHSQAKPGILPFLGEAAVTTHLVRTSLEKWLSLALATNRSANEVGEMQRMQQLFTDLLPKYEELSIKVAASNAADLSTSIQVIRGMLDPENDPLLAQQTG